jgi:hypothetical protein
MYHSSIQALLLDVIFLGFLLSSVHSLDKMQCDAIIDGSIIDISLLGDECAIMSKECALDLSARIADRQIGL